MIRYVVSCDSDSRRITADRINQARSTSGGRLASLRAAKISFSTSAMAESLAVAAAGLLETAAGEGSCLGSPLGPRRPSQAHQDRSSCHHNRDVWRDRSVPQLIPRNRKRKIPNTRTNASGHVFSALFRSIFTPEFIATISAAERWRTSLGSPVWRASVLRWPFRACVPDRDGDPLCAPTSFVYGVDSMLLIRVGSFCSSSHSLTLMSKLASGLPVMM